MSSVHFEMPYVALGDKLCFLSAARIYARIFPGTKVHVGRTLPDVVKEYDSEGLVFQGSAGRRVAVEPGPWHRMHNHQGNNNYVGTYLREMGVQTPPVRPELPKVPPMEGLAPYSYVAFQPWSGYAENPPSDLIDTLLGTLHGKIHVVAVGAAGTDRASFYVDYGYLGSPMNMLRVVRHARFVLTPRSATAHVAAAYGIPTVVWVPNDGEDWHIDYPDWPSRLVEFGQSAWIRQAQLERARASIGVWLR